MGTEDLQLDAFIPPTDETDGDKDYRPSAAPSARDRVVELLRQSDDKLHRFWELWRDDYLAGLREREYAAKKSRDSSLVRQPRVDDIVLVFADNAPRACWRLARITQLSPCEDREVRTARIRFANGHETRRAMSHLYPLELTAQAVSDSSTVKTPGQLCTGAPSPPGGFGPLIGLEEEAPEDPEAPQAEEKNHLDDFAPIATRTRRRVATTRYARWPDVLFDPGTLAQTTHRDGPHEDSSAGRA